MTGTQQALERLIAPVVALSRAGWAALGAGFAAAILGAAAWAARLHWFDGPAWVLVAWPVAIAAMIGLALLARHRAGTLGMRAIAARLESGGLSRSGALVSMLEAPAAGGSEALLESADRTQAEVVRDRDRALARIEPEQLRGARGQ